ncbi:hypothetical protein OV203_46625 [Nannocystis sp. ILAH1]|uniref:hypothetical protein n=1 Tax=Nannocystis sp. ILAH1 TaxID=2996789 RepID=UPI0022700FFB|nr:hypothetical protein [Nannocystis sp. ILAH1]MCY0994690.1 hypothetical protein [Nannocystis sp. ILAH1]
MTPEIAALILERDTARETAQRLAARCDGLTVQCDLLQVRVMELERALSDAREDASRWGETRAFVA